MSTLFAALSPKIAGWNGKAQPEEEARTETRRRECSHGGLRKTFEQKITKVTKVRNRKTTP